MSENISIEYGKNLAPEEVEQLRVLETAVFAALQTHVILGRAQWKAKWDSKMRTVYALERNNGRMLTFYAPHELARLKSDDLDSDIFGRRHSYDDPLSDRPLIFEHLSSEDRANIVNYRQNVSVLVSRAAAKIGNLSSCEKSHCMPTHVEFPPTLGALMDENIAPIVVHAPPGIAGAWQRLFIITYHQGGRVFFREINQDTVEAVFRFE